MNNERRVDVLAGLTPSQMHAVASRLERDAAFAASMIRRAASVGTADEVARLQDELDHSKHAEAESRRTIDDMWADLDRALEDAGRVEEECLNLRKALTERNDEIARLTAALSRLGARA